MGEIRARIGILVVMMPGRGRPCTYNQEIADIICERLAAGESLNAICKAPEMPPEPTVRLWVLDDREGFAANYRRAREIQAARIADELLEIADDGTNDWMAANDPENPGYRVNGEHIQRSRARLDTRKWLLSKMLPKVYGDKVTQEIQGADGKELVGITVNIDPVAAANMYQKLIKGS